MDVQLSTKAVAKVIGATYRQVDKWCREKLVEPSGRRASGKGSRRMFTFEDAILLQTISALRQGHCPMKAIRQAVAYIRSHFADLPASEALSKVVLAADGKRVLIITNGQDLVDAVSQQLQFTWTVPLGQLIIRAKRRIEEMAHTWTESLTVQGREFTILISKANMSAPYVVSCRKFPGAIAEARAANLAIGRIRESIALVLVHQSNGLKRGHVVA